MNIYKTISMLTLISFLSTLASCNSSESEEEKEDREHDELIANASAYALSAENVARQAEAYSPDEGGGGGGGGGFVWKPISESNGKLVVLLPSSFRNVSSITVRGSGGSSSAGRGSIANGGRPHYRFSRSGGSFGHNITVSGGGKTWHISNGSQRYDL